MVKRLLQLLRPIPRGPAQAKEHRVRQLRFLGEQDGPPERTAKEQWRPILEADKGVRTAFLVRVSLDQSAEQTVVLAILRSGGAELALVQALGNVFRSNFVRDVFVDIVFISEEQELQARAVARPFYVQVGVP